MKLRFEAWKDLVLRIFYKRYLLEHIKTRQVIENETYLLDYLLKQSFQFELL